MVAVPSELERTGFAATHRRDAWWVAPLVQGVGLATLISYANWAAFQGRNYLAGNYLSPLYSPLIIVDWFPFSPAFLILGGPGLFRLTCYYYRKAYYRSFWLAPAACAVRDAKSGYTGEARFPLFLQNFHRYAWYVAVLFIVMLTWDAILAFRFKDGFGIGVGTIVMWINVVFLAGYTFSCHSCRHVCGGAVDIFSKAPVRYSLWRGITRLNEKHPMFAWLSLFSVGLTDVYIRLVSMGIIRDWRII